MEYFKSSKNLFYRLREWYLAIEKSDTELAKILRSGEVVKFISANGDGNTDVNIIPENLYGVLSRELDRLGIQYSEIVLYASKSLRYNEDDLWEYTQGVSISIEDGVAVFHNIEAVWGDEFFGFKGKPDFDRVCKNRMEFPCLVALLRLCNSEYGDRFLMFQDEGDYFSFKTPTEIRARIGYDLEVRSMLDSNLLIGALEEITKFSNDRNLRAHRIVWSTRSEYYNIYIYPSSVDGEVDLYVW